jgi:hypothetical protein
MPRVMRDTALAWLDDLPPYEHESHDIRATLNVIAGEVDLIDAAKEKLRAQFWPQTADDQITIYEELFEIGGAAADKTLEQRRTAVLAEEQKLSGDGSGIAWQANLTRLIGTGWSYQEHDPGDSLSPPPNVIGVDIPFATQLDVPATPTAVASSGGAFAAATYSWVVTTTNAYGETTASGPVTLAVSAGQKVTLDWPDVTGGTGYAIYRRSGSGPYLRLTTVTVSTYVDTGTAATGAPPPATNTTQGYQAFQAKQLARSITPAHVDLAFGYTAGFILGVSRLGDAL